MNPRLSLRGLVLAGLLFAGHSARAQAVATSVSGFYGTGMSLNASTDQAWKVTGAYTNGSNNNVSASLTAYTGGSYTSAFNGQAVLNSHQATGFWISDQTSGKWIVTPYTNDSSQHLYAGYYAYQLTFTIGGTGSGAVSNFSLTMSAAADNAFYVYVNPTETTGGMPDFGQTPATGYADTGSYTPGSTVTLNSSNANFKIGSNTLVFVVYNNNTALNNNSSGLIVYGLTGYVPEVSPWMPIAGAIGAYGLVLFVRKRRTSVTGETSPA